MSTNLITPAATSANLIDQINAAHHACIESANHALDHGMHAGDLLKQAKDACGHGDWQKWLANNFTGAARTARMYMQLAERRTEIEAKRQRDTVLSISEARRLIAAPKADSDGDDLFEQIYKPDPSLTPTSGALMFAHVLPSCGADYLFIEPSNDAGYFFVSVIRFAGDGGFIEGTKRPVADYAIRFTVEGLGAERCARSGKRHEVSGAEPLKFNRWLYDSYESYQEQLIEGWRMEAQRA